MTSSFPAALVSLLITFLVSLLLLHLSTVLDPDAALPRVKKLPPLPLRFRHDGAFKVLQVGRSGPTHSPCSLSLPAPDLAPYSLLRWRTCTSATAPPRVAWTWSRMAAARCAPTSTPRVSCAGSSRRRSPTSLPSLVRFFLPPLAGQHPPWVVLVVARVAIGSTGKLGSDRLEQQYRLESSRRFYRERT
jgi:hypothetical protein